MASAVRSGMAPGARAHLVVWLSLGIVLSAGGIAALYSSTQNSALSSYNVAPTCAALADAAAGQDCRFTAIATVTGISYDEVDFNLPGPYSPLYLARFPSGVQPDSSLKVGDQVPVEFWGLRVTRLGGAVTTGNPASDPTPGYLLEIGLLLLPLGLGATGWAVVTARKAGRGDGGDLGTRANMNPVAMSDALWR